MGATNVKKLSQNSDYDIEEDAEDYVTRPPRSAIRYTRPPQRDTLDDVDIPKGPSIQRRALLSARTQAMGWYHMPLLLPGARHGFVTSVTP